MEFVFWLLPILLFSFLLTRSLTAFDVKETILWFVKGRQLFLLSCEVWRSDPFEPDVWQICLQCYSNGGYWTWFWDNQSWMDVVYYSNSGNGGEWSRLFLVLKFPFLGMCLSTELIASYLSSFLKCAGNCSLLLSFFVCPKDFLGI